MSKLTDLINELCPDGVEFKPLVECCNVLDRKRKPVTKSAREAGEYPYYGANGIQDYVSDYIFDGIFVLVGEDGSVITEKGNPVVNWAEGKIWVNNHAHIIEEKEGVLLRYLYHYLQTVNVSAYIHGNIPKLTGGDFKAISIPVPPLEVQREIVRVLDSFTLLTAELTAELTARKKQYEFYRNRLLWFGKNIKSIPLSQIANVFRGEYITQKNSIKGNIPVILGGQEPAYYIDKSNHEGEIVVIARSGASAGFVSYWNEPIFVTDGFGYEAKKDVVFPRYLYYVLKNMEQELNLMKRGAGVPHVSGEMLGKIELPVPDINVQKKVVEILDSFDGICNDLNIGLPAEIEARQVQYEYYRDKLLSFKELGA